MAITTQPNSTPNKVEKWRDGANHRSGQNNGAKLQGASEFSTVDQQRGACQPAPAEVEPQQPADANERCVAWEWVNKAR